MSYFKLNSDLLYCGNPAELTQFSAPNLELYNPFSKASLVMIQYPISIQPLFFKNKMKVSSIRKAMLTKGRLVRTETILIYF